MKTTIVFLFLSVVCNYCNAQCDNYELLINKISEMEANGQYHEAFQLIAECERKYPDKWFEISKEKKYLNEQMNLLNKNLELFKEGHKRGFFYLLHPDLPQYKEYVQLKGFDTLCLIDLELRKLAMEASETIYEINVPDKYKHNDKYPLMIIFHGGGSSLNSVKKHWHSEWLNTNFIKVYLQSYRHYDSKTFGWRSGDKRADNDIREIFHKICTEYPVDTSRVVLAGISAGATYAIDVALRKVIPATGLLVFCPGLPQHVSENKTQESEVQPKTYMVAGENDYYRERQLQLIDYFEKTKVPVKYTVIEEMGHQYPEKESFYIDQGIQFIFTDSL